MSGKVIGRVRIGELIARGGMAEVYYGEHTSLDRRVAVKIMRDHVDDDPDTRARFEREARVVASLQHPNIIQIFDYELADGRPCIVMELVEGVSLGNYLKALQKRGEQLPFDMIARILGDIASAVDYAHSQNIVHRDIKPPNVLLRSKSGIIGADNPLPEDVEPVLTDFGLVRLLDSSIQTSTGTVSGTPAYMSPEQARGDRVDRKTDIYSLGVMLYEMLAGDVPFGAESSFGVLMKHLNEPPPPIPGISAGLQAIIDRALAKNPALRYDSARQFVDEFIAVFNGETVSINTLEMAKMARQPDRQKQPRPWLAALAGAGILAVVGLLAFLAFRPSLSLNANQAVGGVSFQDFNAIMDKAVVTLTALPAPEAGTHYEVWFLAPQEGTWRKAGGINMDATDQGQLVFIAPDQENILSLFDQVEVTIEANNDPSPNEPSGDVIASSVFPPLALIHVRHVLTTFHGAPDDIALIQGLWHSVDRVDDSIIELQQGLENGDEALVRTKNEEIINQLAGSANVALHRDWNENGSIDDPGDGFGVLANGEAGGLGYIPVTASHVVFAAEAADATDNIRLRSSQVVTCIENMKGWSEQLLGLALKLQETPFGAEMRPIVLEMKTLSDQILFGMDANGNGLIEPIPGEGGGDTAYAYAYFMAEMPLFPGGNRTPPPAQTP
jgi:tRNA A-37 threonylcarbamoyl transferase component Bud32